MRIFRVSNGAKALQCTYFPYSGGVLIEVPYFIKTFDRGSIFRDHLNKLVVPSARKGMG